MERAHTQGHLILITRKGEFWYTLTVTQQVCHYTNAKQSLTERDKSAGNGVLW